MSDKAEKPPAAEPVVRHQHTPNALALLRPNTEICELIITTMARQSQVYALTYEQVCLLASDAELARITFVENRKKKKSKS
jgi:hypothetical protein